MDTDVRSSTQPRLALRPMTRLRAVLRMGLFALIAGALAVVPVAVPAQAGIRVLTSSGAVRAPYCGIWWGSLPKVDATTSVGGDLYGVRAGRHTCYDRLVLDVAGPITGYDVRYVDAVHAVGSGAVVPVAGGATIRITIHSPAYDDNGRATYVPRSRSNLVDVRGWDTFRQIAWAGSYEGSTTLALGVRGRLPMRVFVLPGTDRSRLVIDVADRW